MQEKKLLFDMTVDELKDGCRQRSEFVQYSPQVLMDELSRREQKEKDNTSVRIAKLAVWVAGFSMLASIASAVAAFLALKKS